MQSQAGTLAQAVSVFKLNSAGGSPALSHSRPNARKQMTVVAAGPQPKAPRQVARPVSPESKSLPARQAPRSPVSTNDDWEEF
jgi:hypothetical protein